MKERLAIIAGARTPMGKAFGQLKNLSATELGALAIRESIERSGLKDREIEEVIMGNVAQPPDSANSARVAALKAGLPIAVNAYTVHRNCASGMEAVTSAMEKINAGYAKVMVAGGMESMTNVPLFYNQSMTNFFYAMGNRKNGLLKKLQTLLSFRSYFLKPVIGVQLGLTDPVCGLNMGQTAEVLAKEFKISREEQDAFALNSHKKAIKAAQAGYLDEEIFPISPNKKKGVWISTDEGPRKMDDTKKLAKLKPFFDRKSGTVTVGNACPINDGGAALVVTAEKEAKRRKLNPIGYLKDYAYASLDPSRMGLGPVYATAKLLKRNPNLSMKTFDLIEINEAFAAQVIANLKAFGSKTFAKQYLGQEKAVGDIDPSKVNVDGGSIALGHPVGMTGARIILHNLISLKRNKKQNGLATLCIGGGQGAALHLQVK